MAQSQHQTDAEKRAAAEKAEAEKKNQAGQAPQQPAPTIQVDRTPAGQNLDTTLTEETARQLAEGRSPISDDATADAERSVADEPTAAARDWRAAGNGPSVNERLDALEADLAKLRGQLRHSL